MNPAPALLAVPEYDYILIETWMQDTHARRDERKQARHYFKSKREAVGPSSLSGHCLPAGELSKTLYTLRRYDTMTPIK